MVQLGVLGILLASAIYDVKFRKISNNLLLLFMILGIIGRVIWAGFPDAKDSSLAFFVPLVLLPLYSAKILGAGDIKLLMVVGFWIGFESNLHLMVYSSLLGGMLSFVWMALDSYRWKRLSRLKNYFVACILHKRLLTYEEFSCGGKKNNFPLAIAFLLGYSVILYQNKSGNLLFWGQ